MARRKTDKEFKEEVLTLVGTEYTFLEEYVNSSTKILVRHNSKECNNNEYLTKPNIFLMGRRCPKCANKKRVDKLSKGTKSNEEWIKELQNKAKGEFEFENLSGKLNSRTSIKVRHLPCNSSYVTNPSEFLRNKGCRKCSHKDTTKRFTKKKEEFLKEVYSLVEGDYIFLEDYVNTYTPLKVKHEVCGAQYMVAPRDFLKGLRCSVCSSSRGEKSLVEYFIKKDIEYETQKSYDDLKDEGRLYFDFYLPNINTLIEYNGKQHYEPIEFFGGESTFKKQQKHDAMKREYARSKGIKLIEIPYYYKTTKHITKLLDDIL